jgi:hypothetical protein
MSYACLPSVGKFGDRKISSQLEIHKDCQTRMPRAQSGLQLPEPRLHLFFPGISPSNDPDLSYKSNSILSVIRKTGYSASPSSYL